MSSFAEAINDALGVSTPPAPAPIPTPERAISPAGTRPLAQRVREDIGRVVSSNHRGFMYIVRENGVTGIYPDCGKFSYWHIFFYTDEELRLDQPGLNVEKRVEIAKKAIDRYLDAGPVYTGIWYLRNLNP